MKITLLRLLGLFVIFAVSIFACNIDEEKEVWNSCLEIENKVEKKSCIVQFEKRFYPESLYDDEELKWSDIDWTSN